MQNMRYNIISSVSKRNLKIEMLGQIKNDTERPLACPLLCSINLRLSRETEER